MTATDANRFVLRLARHLTGRPKVLRDGLVLPRHGRRHAWRCSTSTARVVPRAGALGPPVDPALDHPRRAVQRRRRARARARPRRRRLRADGAGAHQHRHRAARARLPRRGARAHPRVTARCSSSTRPTRSASVRAARRRRGASSPTSSCIGKTDRRRHAGRRLRHDRRGRRAARRPRSPTTGSTCRASAARSPATRSRSPPCGPRCRTTLRAEDFAVATPLADGVGRRRRRRDRRAPACRGTCNDSGCRAEYWFCPPPRYGRRGRRRQSTTSSMRSCTCGRSTGACCSPRSTTWR